MPTRNGSKTKRSEPSTFAAVATQPVETVQQHPFSSMILAFGVGMGLGMLACVLACDEAPPPETTTERWSRQLSEAVRDLGRTIVRNTSAA
jgi:hypothetical protein